MIIVIFTFKFTKLWTMFKIKIIFKNITM